jgi:hypothetical protein
METKRAGIVFVGEFTGIGKETYPLHQLTIPGLFTTKYTKEISRCTWSWENHGNIKVYQVSKEISRKYLIPLPKFGTSMVHGITSHSQAAPHFLSQGRQIGGAAPYSL